MARHYQPRQFFREASNALLADYFKQKGITLNIKWDELSETDSEVVFDAFLRIDDAVRADVGRELQAIYLFAGDGGTKAIANEALFRNREPGLPAMLSKMKNHLDRALWTFLNRPKFWEVAIRFSRADAVPRTYWRSRSDMPARPGEMNEEMKENLEKALGEHFYRTEAKGKNCKVEVYRRGDLEYVFAYPEDWARTSIEWIENKFERRPMNPAFEMIFRHNDRERKLDIYYDGDRNSVSRLHVLFAKSVMGETIPLDAQSAQLTFDLRPLLDRDFEFTFSADLGISSVVVTSMRITVGGEPWRRMTLEVDPGPNSKAIYDFLDMAAREIDRSLLSLDKVSFRVGLIPTATTRTRQRSFSIALPNSCNLEGDEVGDRIRRMLMQSGLEPRRIEPEGSAIA